MRAMERDLLLAVAVLVPAAAPAQAPVVTHVLPAAAAPGQTVELTFHGSNLGGATALWASFPGTILPASAAANGPGSDRATFRVLLDENATLGVGGLRLWTRQGVSSLKLFLIDDLPSRSEGEGNDHPESAPQIEPGVAIDGACQPASSDYYRFTARSGERLSVEVVAGRLGSKLDPVLRLLDSRGREVAHADDTPGIGPDCGFTRRFAAAGEHVLEVGDARHQGGVEYRYRLRLGDFPVGAVPFPLGGRAGTTLDLTVSALGTDASLPVRLSLPENGPGSLHTFGVRHPGGGGSGLAAIAVSSILEEVEVEPDAGPGAATRIAPPCAVNGRLVAPGDRDGYSFQARKGERLAFAGRARSLGSPAHLHLRLETAAGAVLAEAENLGPEEGRLEHAFGEDGPYRLVVEDLNLAGGPRHAYRVEIESARPGFGLSLEEEKFDAPPGGSFTARVKLSRREYDGPVRLSVAGAGGGFALEPVLVPAKQNEATVKVTLPPGLKAGLPVVISLIGSATIGGGEVSATASTRPALRTLFPETPFPPPALDGSIGVGVTEPLARSF